MSDERKTSVWALVAALLIGLPGLYVASFGPACWFSASHPAIAPRIAKLYWPLTKAAWACPGDLAMPALWRYGMLSPHPRSFKTLVKMFAESSPYVTESADSP
jgi:hypothetical protein